MQSSHISPTWFWHLKVSNNHYSRIDIYRLPVADAAINLWKPCGHKVIF